MVRLEGISPLRCRRYCESIVMYYDQCKSRDGICICQALHEGPVWQVAANELLLVVAERAMYVLYCGSFSESGIIHRVTYPGSIQPVPSELTAGYELLIGSTISPPI